MRTRSSAFLLVALLVATPTADAQQAQEPDTRTVVAGAEYADSHAGLDWLLGAGYRDVWAEPFEADVLDLNAVGGGLTPVMRVGGLQTLGLALAGENGRSYTFRSIDKAAPLVLPPGFEGTGVEYITQDQVSSSLPAADLVSASLARSAGILHAQSRIVVMPDDERLGEYREAFAGAVGLFYEFPTGGSFGSTDVYDADDLLERMRAGTDRPDTHAFLRARLLDLLIGDWDRHYGQWRWARMPGEAGLQPIPEDRDQAFSQYDGLVLDIARAGGAQMTLFEGDYPSIDRLAFNGTDFDRWILGGIDREQWLAVAADLAATLTNAAIHEAVASMPAPHYELRGEELESTLRDRRDRLVDYAGAYYAFLAEQVDIHGTDRDERVEVRRFPSGNVNVTMRFADEETPYFERQFFSEETREVRIYVAGGDDHVQVEGNTRRALTVRVIGGPGSATVQGTGRRWVKTYEDADGDGYLNDLSIDTARNALGPLSEANFEIQMPGSPYRDWGGITKPVFVGKWHRDLGLAVGGGVDVSRFGFGKVPWSSRHIVAAAYAIGSNNAMFTYQGDFRRAGGGPHFETQVYVTGFGQLRYHGFGNETSEDGPSSFYDIGQRQSGGGFYLAWGEVHNPVFRIGPSVRFVDSRSTDPDSLLALDSPYGIAEFGTLGLDAEFRYDSRRDLPTLASGFNINATGSWHPKAWDVESAYGTFVMDAAGHIRLGNPVTVAVLVGGKTTFGDYPYFDAAYLGGEDTFSAYAWNRFAGDSMIRGGLRVRWSLATLNIAVPGDVGLTFRADAGRVYLEGEESRRWHPQMTVALFYAAFDRLMLAEIGVGFSRERTIITFDADLDWLMR